MRLTAPPVIWQLVTMVLEALRRTDVHTCGPEEYREAMKPLNDEEVAKLREWIILLREMQAEDSSK